MFSLPENFVYRNLVLKIDILELISAIFFITCYDVAIVKHSNLD